MSRPDPRLVFKPLDAKAIDYAALVRGAAAAHLWADAMIYTADGELVSAGIDPGSCDGYAEELDDWLSRNIASERWKESAIATVREVEDWAKTNALDVILYIETTGRDEEHVGHDFALSRSGHGTGLWDRGAGEVGDRLHEAAKIYGSVNLLVTQDDPEEAVDSIESL